jgi:hypothetical protein
MVFRTYSSYFRVFKPFLLISVVKGFLQGCLISSTCQYEIKPTVAARPGQTVAIDRDVGFFARGAAVV